MGDDDAFGPQRALAGFLSVSIDNGIRRGVFPVLGVSGPQGSGKSTVCAMLAEARTDVAVVSLDDFYLTRADRVALAETISPLFATRGPPGTHDLALLHAKLDALQRFSGSVALPVFSKRDDDRAQQQRVVTYAPRAIVLEGWCVGATVPDDFLTGAPLNAVEARDWDGAWRAYQAAQLAGPYAALWDRITDFIHFTAPDFDVVLHWRLQQEETNLGAAVSPERRAWVADFVGHYERITRAMAAGARRSGSQILLGEDRRPLGSSVRT